MVINIKIIYKNIPVPFLVVIALLLAFAGWEVFKYQLVPKRFGVVEQGKIFRSGRIAPPLLHKTLRKHGIKVIVDLTDDFSLQDPACRAEQEATEELGINRYNFPLRGDGTGNITNYARAISAIKQAKDENKPVLVHCAAGAQRTGGVIASYRLLVEKQMPVTAYAELTRYGWKSRSKDKILLEYLNDHMAELNSLLQEMEVIRRERRSIPQIAP
ncbi:MAG: dual specificity protein phosphatase family protein [Kiritimatiellia bacterium]|nr:dual specificity protein phosphatase family protein [Kiritimatiellia bacterium]